MMLTTRGGMIGTRCNGHKSRCNHKYEPTKYAIVSLLVPLASPRPVKAPYRRPAEASEMRVRLMGLSWGEHLVLDGRMEV